MQLSINNQSGGIINVFKDSPVTIHQSQGQQTIDVLPSSSANRDSSSDSPALDSENTHLFCCITKAAYDKGIAQQVEDELRSACVSAPKLVKAIKTNEALGYLDTKNLTSEELFDLLNEHFGLHFKPRNFRYYRSK